MANCRFCQIQVGNRRPAPTMDESLDLDRSRPRRTTTPLISSPQVSPSSTINRRVRPSRRRTRPRHFDSSPDLDVPRGCEKTLHFPSKTLRDFIDSQVRQHATCNECRQNPQRPRQPIPQLSQSTSARRPLQDVTNQFVNRPLPINRPSLNIQNRSVPPLTC